jgi:transposase-like protein
VTHQSPSYLKLKALIAQLGRLAQGVLTDKKFGDEMLRTLRSGAKDTTVVAAKDPCHLGKARVYTAEDVVQLKEERERLNRENIVKAKMHQEKAAAKVVSSGAG